MKNDQPGEPTCLTLIPLPCRLALLFDHNPTIMVVGCLKRGCHFFFSQPLSSAIPPCGMTRGLR
jgi:hypothetical protein